MNAIESYPSQDRIAASSSEDRKNRGKNRKRTYRKNLVRGVCLMALCMAVMVFGGCGGTDQNDESKLDPEDPVTITLWTYYNGAQLDAINSLIDSFNRTEGRDLGIIVESSSQGSINELKNMVLDIAAGESLQSKLPNIFVGYPDAAFALDAYGKVVDLAPYFSKEEMDSYVSAYMDEGRFSGPDTLKILPAAKSTELFMLNKTDWDKFAAETDVNIDHLSTMEGLLEVARRYYEWTDAQTPEQGDGKAFFGWDSMANYIFVGAKQLGVDLVRKEGDKFFLNFDKETLKTLWKFYYEPYIKGYFASFGRFRSDDTKIGGILGYVGSSTGVTFFPSEVYISDEKIYSVDAKILPVPCFASGRPYAVQQGAGMIVTEASEREVKASAVFLKWFTQDERNLDFAMGSAYLPVKKNTANVETIKALKDTDPLVQDAMLVATEVLDSDNLFTPYVFEHSDVFREIIEDSMKAIAERDRETVLQRIESGASMEEAAAEFLLPENFNQWYEKTKAELEEILPSDSE